MLQKNTTSFVEDQPTWTPSEELLPDPTESSFALGSIRFRDFEIWPSARLLLRRGQAVCVGSRAFDLLVVLLRSRGEIVSKEAIVRHVWPTTLVEESNLRFQVASLRRALGPDRELIKSIPGRGYLLASDQATGNGVYGFGFTTGPDQRGSNIALDTLSRSERTSSEKPHAMEGEALETFLKSAGQLIAVYGSIEALIGALVQRKI